MRSAVWLAIGTILGGAGGYLVGTRNRPSDTRAAAEAETEAPVGATSASPSAPDLAVPPPASPRPFPSTVTFDLKAYLELATNRPGVTGAQVTPTLAVWDTLAAVYARTGAAADLEAVLVAALLADVPATAIEAILPLAPAKDAAAILRRLRSAYPKAAWNDLVFARLLLLAGDDAEGARVGLAALAPDRTDAEVLARLAGAVHRSAGARSAAALAEAFERLKAAGAGSNELLAFARDAEREIGADAARPYLDEVARRRAAEREAADARQKRILERTRLNAVGETIAHPEWFAAWSTLGDVERSAGNPVAAYQALRRANELAPNDLGTIESMIEIDPREAVGLLEKRVAEIPDDEGLDLLVLTLLKLDRGREAGEAFFRLARPERDSRLDWGFASLAPDAAIRRLKPFLGTRERHLGIVRSALAQAYEALGRRAEAVAALEEARADEPWAYYRAIVRVAPEEGIKTMTVVAEQEPQNGEAHLLLARALRLAGRLDAARASIATALRLDASWHEIRIEAALIDPETALPYLVELAKRGGQDQRWLGDVYTQSGRWSEARAAYDRCLADNPDNLEVLIAKCRCR